jgi:tetratricopeptide (TPR) repeat protein
MDDLASEARAWAHIGLDYSLQGLFEEAKSNLEKAIEIYREIDGKQGLQWVLGLLSRLLFDTGQTSQAEKNCEEALEIAQSAGIKYYEKYSWWMLGRVHLAQGKIDQAEQDFQKAENELNEGRRNNGVLASFAEIEMIRGNFEKAFSLVEEILVEGTRLPYEIDNKDRLEILLTCYQVLVAIGDERAQTVLKSAYALLTEQAQKIMDQTIRQAFLQNVPANREILAAYNPKQ